MLGPTRISIRSAINTAEGKYRKYYYDYDYDYDYYYYYYYIIIIIIIRWDELSESGPAFAYFPNAKKC